jgi:hypothetical protein
MRLKYNKPVRATNKMTYILGSRCKDGVVLVADTKITVDNGEENEVKTDNGWFVSYWLGYHPVVALNGKGGGW